MEFQTWPLDPDKYYYYSLNPAECPIDYSFAVALPEKLIFKPLRWKWFEELSICIVSSFKRDESDKAAIYLEAHRRAAAVRPYYAYHKTQLAGEILRNLRDTRTANEILDQIQTDDTNILREVITKRMIARLIDEPESHEEPLKVLSDYTAPGPEHEIASWLLRYTKQLEAIDQLELVIRDVQPRATDEHQCCLEFLLLQANQYRDLRNGNPWPIERITESTRALLRRHGKEPFADL